MKRAVTETEEVTASPVRNGAAQRRRILFAVKTEAFGGSERHLLGLLKRIDLASVQPIVLCFDQDPLADHLADDLRAEIEIRKVRARSFWEFRRAFLRAKPDIVCFVFGYHFSFWLRAICAARCSGACSFVAIEHHILPGIDLPPATRRGGLINSFYRILGGRARQLYKRRATGWLWARLIDLTVCVSHAVQDADVNAYCIRKRATAVVLNGVDVNYFTPARAPLNIRRQLGAAESEPLLLHVGRLVKEKRLDVLVEACARLRARGRPMTCLIVGEGPMEQDLRLLAEKLGIAHWVRFMGFQPDLRPFYRGADLFVLSSCAEGFGLVLAEAMACGLPCVATRIGGVPEVVTDGVDGWLVEPESPEALIEGVSKALAQHRKLKEFGQRGRAKVVERFNEEIQARAMLSALFGNWSVRQENKRSRPCNANAPSLRTQPLPKALNVRSF